MRQTLLVYPHFIPSLLKQWVNGSEVTFAMQNSQAAVQIRNLKFSYKPSVASRASATSSMVATVLDISELSIERGEAVFLYGPSGSGKTTLLGLLAGILHAPQGELNVLGQNLSKLSGTARDTLRASHMGYIFQMFNLIPYLNVLENILLPCRINAERRNRLKGESLEQGAERLASHLGISTLLNKKVTELSVGQQQRVAAARALLGAPELIIADEPTSALDSNHREQFLQLLFAECRAQNSTLIFVSHDAQLMPLFNRCLSLPDLNRAVGGK